MGVDKVRDVGVIIVVISEVFVYNCVLALCNTVH